MRYGGVEGVKRRRLGAEVSSSAAASDSPVCERASEALLKVADPVLVKAPDVAGASAFDLDLLDCTICTEPLASPIYQCHNGHVACASCSKLTSNICPSCQQPTGSIRCLVLEKLIDSLKVRCKFSAYGCRAMVKFSDKPCHERICLFEPLDCPFPNCYVRNLRYSLLHDHISNIHPGNYGVYDTNTVSFVMKPKDRLHVVFGTDVCFVVNRRHIGTIGKETRFSHPVGDMCFLTILKVLLDRYATQETLPYMMKLKTVGNGNGGASSSVFTVEADWSMDGSEPSDGFVVLAEGKSVEIVDVVFRPPRSPSTLVLDLLGTQRAS